MFERIGFSSLLGPAVLSAALAVASATSASPTRLLSGMPPARDRVLIPTGDIGGFAPRMAPKSPDTLEVHAFLVEYLLEKPDNSATTGNGTFGSDSSTRTHLESWRAHRDSTRLHYLKLFQGVSEYWRTASGGKLEVEFRVFPEQQGAKPYTLPRTIGQYSPVGPAKNQSRASFDSVYVVRIMEMVADAARLAAADPKGPFSVALPTTPTRNRAYMMIHAGASRSSDGGEGGGGSANTAADIGDFTVGASDHVYLGIRKLVRDSAYLKDTLGVVLDTTKAKSGASTIDTLKNLLVMSETATQDGMNWGLRGTAVNLVGRALGLPDLYDTWRGMSVMGQFCVMDWAGSYLGRNSTPALPSAWPRLFMGWATPVVATPSGPSRFRLPAVRPENGNDTVLVVRINDGEYLLVENRQRTDFSGDVWVKTGTLGNDSATWRTTPDSLDKFLKDSTKTRGYVLGSSPDAGLPGSGLLVWHVNEWLLRELVRSGAPNSYLGDTLSDRYKGITLVQASGKQTLGRVFQGITGQSASDVGSGSDILPHARRRSSVVDTITAIGPEGYASTGSLLGGRSLVTLRAPWPNGSLAQKGTSSLEGDSVWTPGAAAIEIELDWGALRRSSDAFPVRTVPSWGDQAMVPGPASLPRSVWILDTTGRAQLLDSTGAHWFSAKDTARIVASWDSTPTAFQNRPLLDTILVPLAKIGSSMGWPAQSAVGVDTLAVRDAKRMVRFKWPAPDAFLPANRDSARFLDTSLDGRFTAGPVFVAGSFWVGDSTGRLFAVGSKGIVRTIPTGLSSLQSICATIQGGKPALAAVDSNGKASLVDLASGDATRLESASLERARGESFQVLSTDFDRDGSADIAVIGSFGNAVLWSGANRTVFAGWPRRFPRGSGNVGEPGPAALGDMNADGRPELVFGGTDRIYAVEASGVPLRGWPARIVPTESIGQSTASRPYPSGILGSSPLVANLDANGALEVLAGTSNGQIQAWTGSGKAFGGTALAKTSGSGVAPAYEQTRWPLTAGGQVLDSARPPYLPLAFVSGKADKLLALSSLSTVDGFVVSGGSAPWPVALGNAARTGYLPDSLLGAVVARKTGISDFHLFPSPVRKGSATFRYELGKDASSARLTVYDQTGFQILDRNDLPGRAGRQDVALRGLPWGTGVYAARLEIKWAGGGSDEAWVRFGVIR